MNRWEWSWKFRIFGSSWTSFLATDSIRFELNSARSGSFIQIDTLEQSSAQGLEPLIQNIHFHSKRLNGIGINWLMIPISVEYCSLFPGMKYLRKVLAIDENSSENSIFSNVLPIWRLSHRHYLPEVSHILALLATYIEHHRILLNTILFHSYTRKRPYRMRTAVVEFVCIERERIVSKNCVFLLLATCTSSHDFTPFV